jgi:hypothetical protein
MANEQNLIPLNKRSARERKEISRKGAKASNEKQKAKRTFRNYMNILLDQPVKSEDTFNSLVKLGIPIESIDNKMLVAVALFKKAVSEGDVQAVKEIRAITEDEKGISVNVKIEDDELTKSLEGRAKKL